MTFLPYKQILTKEFHYMLKEKCFLQCFLLKSALNTLSCAYENKICCCGYSEVNVLMLLFHCAMLRKIFFFEKNFRKYVL